MFRRGLFAIMLASLVLVTACTTTSQYTQPQSVQNTLYVPQGNHELIWERVVDILHTYKFGIARENRLDGIIETQYKTGSGILEPWHHDSVGAENLAESTFQSIRRRVMVRINPENQGFFISVEAFKELEDLPGIAANSTGGATFQENTPLQRDLDVVTGSSTPSGWLSLGHDAALERAIMNDIRLAMGTGG